MQNLAEETLVFSDGKCYKSVDKVQGALHYFWLLVPSKVLSDDAENLCFVLFKKKRVLEILF
jgi:hypothetical protein